MLLFFLFSFGKLEDSARLTVGFLVPCASTRSTELLGFRATVVGDKQGAVVLHKSLLELVLGVLVNVLLVVGDDRLGDGLTDGVDLRGVTTTGDADADVDTSELVGTDDQEGLVDLFNATMSEDCSNPECRLPPLFLMFPCGKHPSMRPAEAVGGLGVKCVP